MNITIGFLYFLTFFLMHFCVFVLIEPGPDTEADVTIVVLEPHRHKPAITDRSPGGGKRRAQARLFRGRRAR